MTRALPALLACALWLAGCASVEPKRRTTARAASGEVVPLGEAAYDEPPAPADVPPDVAKVPDAVPRHEPRSASGNAARYEVFGKSYQVLDSTAGFRQKGRASWYGKRFHGRKTANGETYDMYAMSAAHKTLPLPSYVRVTHLANHRSVIVRINDRGPFHPDRIIDLSYAAAAKLGILSDGHAAVEIETVEPVETQLAGRGYLQIAAYGDPINAVSMREELTRLQLPHEVEIWTSEQGEESVHRVVIGPFASESAAQLVRNDLQGRGLEAHWVSN